MEFKLGWTKKGMKGIDPNDVVLALQWTGNNLEEMEYFCGDALKKRKSGWIEIFCVNRGGNVCIRKGEYVVRNLNDGTFDIVKDREEVEKICVGMLKENGEITLSGS